MGSHYYSQRPDTEHQEQEISLDVSGKRYRFITDSSVFSKARVDFGTRFLIETMDVEECAHVLDIGCGYGPLGIVAADSAPKGRAVLLDINERAISLATRNIELNRISHAEAKVSDVYGALGQDRFDHILTNPPVRAGKSVVWRIFEEGRNYLTSNGSLWVVIQKKQGAPSALKKLQACYKRVEEVDKKKGYRIFRAYR